MINNDIYDNLEGVPRDKKIAIWGLEKKSFDILTQTINHRIKVHYFIDDTGEYNGLGIFDKDILTKEEALAKENIFIIISSNKYEEYQGFLQKYFSNKFYVMEIGGLDRKIKESDRIFIYGAGNAGKRTLEVLNSFDIQISGFIDSDSKKWGKQWCGYSIFAKDILNDKDVVIISAVYYGEIYKSLRENFKTENIFVDYRNSRISSKTIYYNNRDSVFIKYKDFPIKFITNMRLFYTTIWNDIENKKVILYGRNEVTKQVIEIFLLLGICIEYIVDDICDEEENYMQYKLRDVYDLAYEDMTDKIVIYTKIDDIKSQENARLVHSYSDKLEKINIKWYSQYKNILAIDRAERMAFPDSLMGSVLIYTKSKKTQLGVHACNEEFRNKKIVILGGSTSTPYIYENVEKSWPEYLGDKYEDITVYSLAQPGFDSTRELLKLIRDVKQLEPDLVISYSGVNDMIQPKVKNRPFEGYMEMEAWLGVEDYSTPSDFWIQMERYMKAICDVNGSEFIGILSPILAQKQQQDLSQEEKRYLLVWNNENRLMATYQDFAEKIKKHIPKYEWMYDLTDVFNDVKEWIYKDNCHLTSRGNEIIAENIYNIINDYYEKKRKNL